ACLQAIASAGTPPERIAGKAGSYSAGAPASRAPRVLRDAALAQYSAVDLPLADDAGEAARLGQQHEVAARLAVLDGAFHQHVGRQYRHAVELCRRLVGVAVERSHRERRAVAGHRVDAAGEVEPHAVMS